MKTIIAAWYNVIVKDDQVEEEAKRRAEICANCPLSKHGKILRFVKDNLKEVEGHYCADCGCPLTAKIRSQDICKKWNQDTKR